MKYLEMTLLTILTLQHFSISILVLVLNGYVGSTITDVDDEQGTFSIDLGKDKILDANYCAVKGLGNFHSQVSITGHTQTVLSWNLINLWYLATIGTILFLIPSTSADDYTASKYFNLLIITVTSLFQSCPSTLCCP